MLQDLIFAALLFSITGYFTRYVISRLNSRLPPGPWGFPVIGCLPLLGSMPHAALAKLAQKYGPIMYLKLGTRDIVVASKPDSARAFLKNLDQNFCNRSPNAGAKHMTYGAQDFVFAEYGSRWKLLRRMTGLHMLGPKSFGDWALLRAMEIGLMIQSIYHLGSQGRPVVIRELLSCAMANIIGQKSISRRVFLTHGSESNDFKKMIVETMRLSGLFNFGDYIPSIAWMDLQRIEGKMKNLHKKFDVLLTKMIDEHVSSYSKREGNEDFLDVVMAEEELSMVNIKALLQNLFVAGTDTSTSTIEWGLAEILRKPSILKRAQEEMDRVIGMNRLLNESDLPNLPYLQAICKETFRLHPAAPLNLTRVSTESCEINGYYLPKNTTLLVNIWAIGRDPDVWPNPLQFDPDRFLSEKNMKIDMWGNDFELIPFGAGRRMCAGIRMGITLVGYILGTLVHSFELRLLGNELNMDEAFGIVLQKAVPLSVAAIPRLRESIYDMQEMAQRVELEEMWYRRESR